jgi:polyphosphate kinase
MIRGNFREYLEELVRDGYTVRHDEHGSDPDPGCPLTAGCN